ncbi:hypothetical protein [Agromyces ramosus]|uniref:Secreted protein n=1 Tax=Agromyces ramosus TaxID=33879 RepID=A0ABU0RA96_9MICO|nr:hypothetical protein [Agromyces ramosus]MDQ0895004.1 hypothetical protein [Agromyces ramosus]
MTDALALVLLSGLSGAVLTVIGGFIGAAIQGRREHRKWVQERRYEAFVALEKHLHRWRVIEAGTHRLAQERGVMSEDSSPDEEAVLRYRNLIREADSHSGARYDAMAGVVILGPPSVERAAQAVLRTRAGDDDSATIVRVDDALIAEMRVALGIRN